MILDFSTVNDQTNITAQKCGVIGFGRTLAREGAKYNIISNILAPTAGTNMTRTIWPEEMVQALKPEYVAPLVGALCSEKPPATGQVFEAGGGWFAMTRWQRARGHDFDFAQGIPSVEAVADKFSKICDFDNGEADHPDMPADGSKYTISNVLKHSDIQAENMQRRKRGNGKIPSKI